MEFFANLWSAYAICYAIGYMLWVRPRIKGNQRKWDLVFYISLVVFSTVKWWHT
jgi:hypothetical protein